MRAILVLILTINMSFCFSDTLPFNSLEDFITWERNLKINAHFNSQYKAPDYIFIGLRDSGPESANGRYNFLKNNPQYISDYENIHKGQLTKFPTDGSTMIKTKWEDLPSDIADYYRNHFPELLAAEGFGFDPVLARKVYTGEIQLPNNTNKSEWLRSHAWTKDGIIEKNNPVALAKADYSGNYVRENSDSTTTDPQLKGNLELYNKIQKDLDVLASRISHLKSSIGLSLQTSSSGKDSLDCKAAVSSLFQGRCDELKTLTKSYRDLEENSEKVKKLIAVLDPSRGFPKIARDSSLASTTVERGTSDVFSADREASDCTIAVLKGWKCLTSTVKTLDGNEYKVLLKWNRAFKKSVGTVLFGVGGSGTEEVMNNPDFKTQVEQLDVQDNVRFVLIQMLDEDKEFPLQGGYWIHGGSYETLAQVFMSILDLGIEKNLFHGDFLNYSGGSNGTMMLASAMARYNADAYFQRAIFHAGPFLPSLANACDKNSSSSFYLSTQAQQNTIFDFLARWTFKDPKKLPCENMTEDRTSLLKPDLKKVYPNTHIHIIMGEKEVETGFGKWILASNLEWYQAINAKSKHRIVRRDIGHEMSYQDMRSLMRLGPDNNQ